MTQAVCLWTWTDPFGAFRKMLNKKQDIVFPLIWYQDGNKKQPSKVLWDHGEKKSIEWMQTFEPLLK